MHRSGEELMVDMVEQEIPWKSKKDSRLFFRGAPTGTSRTHYLVESPSMPCSGFSFLNHTLRYLSLS